MTLYDKPKSERNLGRRLDIGPRLKASFGRSDKINFWIGWDKAGSEKIVILSDKLLYIWNTLDKTVK